MHAQLENIMMMGTSNPDSRDLALADKETNTIFGIFMHTCNDRVYGVRLADPSDSFQSVSLAGGERINLAPKYRLVLKLQGPGGSPPDA